MHPNISLCVPATKSTKMKFYLFICLLALYIGTISAAEPVNYCANSPCLATGFPCISTSRLSYSCVSIIY
jgi:hypothetical protein